MSRRYRMVAVDLDGTLCRSNGVPSRETIVIMNALVQTGTHVVLVSGRPPRLIEALAQEIGTRSPAISSHGAFVFDPASKKSVFHCQLSMRQVIDAMEAVTATVLPLRIEWERGFNYGYWPPHHMMNPDTRHLGDDLSQRFTKLAFWPAKGNPAKIATQLREAYNIRGVRFFNEATPFIEIHSANGGKLSALTKVCELLEIQPNQVVAFGDMPSDAAFVRWAGMGFAMHGSELWKLGTVSRVSPPNNEDGVAITLARLFDL